MRFLETSSPGFDLTYNDVFMVPGISDITSRFEVDLTTPDAIGTTIPIIVSNMNAVAGRRMAETVARRGGIAVLPQDSPMDMVAKNVAYVQRAHQVFETPVALGPDDTIAKALDLIHKRSHRAVIVVDEAEKPIGIFTERDAEGLDRFTRLHKVMSRNVFTLPESTTPKEAYEKLESERLFMAPVVSKQGKLVGALTQKGSLRSDLYKPALDTNGNLLVAAAIGINGEPAKRAKELYDLGIRIIVIDTAHGHQVKMIQAITAVRARLDKMSP